MGLIKAQWFLKLNLRSFPICRQFIEMQNVLKVLTSALSVSIYYSKLKITNLTAEKVFPQETTFGHPSHFLSLM